MRNVPPPLPKSQNFLRFSKNTLVSNKIPKVFLIFSVQQNPFRGLLSWLDTHSDDSSFCSTLFLASTFIFRSLYVPCRNVRSRSEVTFGYFRLSQCSSLCPRWLSFNLHFNIFLVECADLRFAWVWF